MVRPDDGRPLSHTELKGAPTFTEIADSVSSRLEGVIVAGFNVAFDVRFLEAEFERSQRRAPDLVVLDVRQLARLVLGAEGSMVAICNDFDVPLVGTHTAHGDAETAAGLLTHLLDLADEVGVDALERLGVPAPPVGPREFRGSDRVLPRDPTVWPGREHREPVPGLRTTISFDDATVAKHARRSLHEVLDDPGVDERHRPQIQGA
jgi:DNA polymerase III epsilon subunit-like protein